MTRVQLRLELIRIAHHPAQSDKLTLEIAKRYEEAFADIPLEGEGEPAPIAQSASPAPREPRTKTK